MRWHWRMPFTILTLLDAERLEAKLSQTGIQNHCPNLDPRFGQSAALASRLSCNALLSEASSACGVISIVPFVMVNHPPNKLHAGMGCLEGNVRPVAIPSPSPIWVPGTFCLDNELTAHKSRSSFATHPHGCLSPGRVESQLHVWNDAA